MGLISSFLSLLGCGKVPEQPLPEWTKNPRKQKSEAELQKKGIPINPWLPLVDSEEEVKLRTASDVAKRINALMALIAVADGAERDHIINLSLGLCHP
jgi:hypothetical protein